MFPVDDGAVPEKVNGRDVIFASNPRITPTCDAVIDLGVGGRGLDLSLTWFAGGTAPSDPCTSVRGMVASAVDRLADPPLRGPSQDAPGGGWALQDPCVAAGALSVDRVVEMLLSGSSPYTCQLRADDGQVLVDVGLSLDPADPARIAEDQQSGKAVVAVDLAGRPGRQDTDRSGCTLQLRAGPLVPQRFGQPLAPELVVLAPDCELASEVARITFGP